MSQGILWTEILSCYDATQYLYLVKILHHLLKRKILEFDNLQKRNDQLEESVQRLRDRTASQYRASILLKMIIIMHRNYATVQSNMLLMQDPLERCVDVLEITIEIKNNSIEYAVGIHGLEGILREVSKTFILHYSLPSSTIVVTDIAKKDFIPIVGDLLGGLLSSIVQKIP